MTRNLIRFSGAAVALAVLLLWAGGNQPSAQTTITSTTLSSAVNATTDRVVVASATGLAAGSCLYVDGEKMSIRSVSSTTATVIRGFEGGLTAAVRHASGEIVWVGTCDRFATYDQVSGAACTASDARYTPHINTQTGRVFDCEQGFWMERHRDSVAVRDFTVRDSFDGGYWFEENDGSALAITDAAVNIVYGSPLGIGAHREEQNKTAGSWIIADGRLDLSADDTTNNEGVEMIFASTDVTTNGFIVAGTQGACIEASVTVTLIANVDFLVFGFRQNETFVGDNLHTGYTLYNAVGIHNQVDGSIFASEVGTTDDSGVNWGNAETRALKVCISSAGAPSMYYSAAYTYAQGVKEYPTYIQIPNVTNGTTLTAGTQMIPFLSYMHSAGAGDAGVFINWVSLTRLPQ